MLTISKPLSSSQAQKYHEQEFTNSQDNYYSEDERVRGEWHGKLAAQWGLQGEVDQEHFARLADGQHPLTGEQLVEHRAPLEYLNEKGEKVRRMEHRAGWDGTFSAPKTVSLTALVGGDERVRAAHRESVNVALDELEKYVHARIGSNHPPETTGKWQYEPGDLVRYTKRSKVLGIEPGEYARVKDVDPKRNLVTVGRSSGHYRTYDPRRLQGVTLYRETERAFARGDRVQFTAPYREQHVANREHRRLSRLSSPISTGTAGSFVSGTNRT